MNCFYIAINTLKGCILQPFFIISVFGFYFINAVLPLFSQFAFFQKERMLLNSTTETAFLCAILISTIAVAKYFSDEVFTEKSLLIFSKPIKYSQLLLGKFVGILAVLGLFFLITSLTALSIKLSIFEQNIDINQIIIFLGIGLLSLIIALIVNFSAKKGFNHTAILSLITLLTIQLSIQANLADIKNIGIIYLMIFLANTIFLAFSMLLGLFGSFPTIISGNIIILITGIIFTKNSILPNWGLFFIVEIVQKNSNNLSKIIMTSSISMFYYVAIFLTINFIIFQIKKQGNAY